MHFACFRSPPYLVALALAVPAAVAFAHAERFGVAVRAVGSPLFFLVLYPVLEEVVFRGALQSRLEAMPSFARRWQGLTLANVLAAAAFAAAHLLRQPWPWAVAVFLPGLVFGWSYSRYRTLVAPIVLHVAYNGAVYVGANWGTT